MSGMLTLMPKGLCPCSAPDKAAQWRQQFPRVFPPSIPRPPRRSFILYRLCYAMATARPAAWQREAFIRGHKAHQIQLFWKVEAVLPAPKGYSHKHNPLTAILLPLVFSLCRLGEGKFEGACEHCFVSSNVFVWSFFLLNCQHVKLCVAAISACSYCHRHPSFSSFVVENL